MTNRWVSLDTTQAFVTLTLPLGQEPPISNESFLRNYLEVGVWIRCLAMQSHILTLASERASRLERLSASAGMYQQIGLGVEDAVATLIAWSIWSHERSTSLADITAQVLLRSEPKGLPYKSGEMEGIKRKFAEKKKVHVEGRRYLRALVDGIEASNVPGLFGIDWKPHPSIKLVSKPEMEFWTLLPTTIIQHIGILTDP